MAGMYIHIPYCHAKCSYCDFYSTANQRGVAEYVSALIEEATLRKDEISEIFSTLYIGGGTPSILSQEDIVRLVKTFKTPDMEEVTIEANPEDVTESWAEMIAGLGVNRISMGFQSFVDAELDVVGRRHSSEESIRAVKTLRRVGIKEISGDLIYGLPTQTLESWEYSLDKLLSLNLPHVSAYSLSYEPGTRLYAQLLGGKIKEVDEDIIINMYDLLITKMKEAGYEHYEISNFAKPNHRSRHNSSYWRDVPYLGLGVSAHSFDGVKRRVNPINISNYIKTIKAGLICYEIEEETILERYNDYVITALRTCEGINLNDMSKKYDTNRLLADADKYISSGELLLKDNYLSFDEKAWLRSDGVLRDLIMV